MKRIAIIAIGLVALLVGITGVAAPGAILSFARSILTERNLYIIAATRVAVGILFLSSAKQTRMPLVLRVLGILILLAGVLTPLTGVERSRAMLSWWEAQGQTVMRVSMGAAILLGAFLIYAGIPDRRKPPTQENP